MENIRQVKGIWIPIEIWQDKNLSWNEKILLLEIDSFTTQDKECYISNEYISELLSVCETTANKILSSLIDKGYVIKVSFDGRRRYVKSALHFTTRQGCTLEQGSLAQNGNILNTITNSKEEEKDKSFSKKVSKDALFEDCWKQYRRKGAKAKAKAQWDKMTQEEKEMILPHIKAYVSSRELQFQKDFERYLKDKTYSTLVIANNQVIYDPTLGNLSEYSPTLSWQLFYNEDIKCHLYIGHFNGFISDGYEDSKRPNGATVMLNNGRGKIVWDSNSQKWMLVK